MSYAITTPPFLMGADGQSVGLFPASSEWTVSQAAKLLDMSEECVNELLDIGILEFRLDGGDACLKGTGCSNTKRIIETRKKRWQKSPNGRRKWDCTMIDEWCFWFGVTLI